MTYKKPSHEKPQSDRQGRQPEGRKRHSRSEPPITNMMTDPRYLRQSSALVNERCKRVFDVLQLANGDIVTTGTKTVVYHYAWEHQRAS